MEIIDLCWAAGFIDGEGCITINRKRNRNNKYGYDHGLVLKVAQKVPSPLEKLKLLFGGTLTYDKKKAIHVWYLHGKMCQEALTLMAPYLVHDNKKEEAQEALKYPLWKFKKGKATKSLPYEVFCARERVYLGLKTLKGRL